jgi:hypothetical protein
MESSFTHDIEHNHNALRQHLPSTLVSQHALDVAQQTLPRSILHHSIRVFLFAMWLAARENDPLVDDAHQIDLLAVACLCHDFGATAEHDGNWRFEVCGADAAVGVLEGGPADLKQNDKHQVWTAIALHTSPHIAERIDPFTRLVRMGVLIDFRPGTRAEVGANGYFDEVVARLPRLDIEKELGDAVVAQAVKDGAKAPAASWPGVLLRSHLEDPSWEGVNKAF